MGKGVGDIYIKAKCNLLIQTYSIEDCWRYYPDTITSTMTPNWELPQNYKLTFEIYHQSQGIGTAWYLILKDPYDSKRCVIGYIQDATKYQVWAWNGSSEQKYTSQYSSQTGVWHEEEITVENGTLTFHDLTVTPPNVDLNTLISIIIYRTSAQFRNIKIKPL